MDFSTRNVYFIKGKVNFSTKKKFSTEIDNFSTRIINFSIRKVNFSVVKAPSRY